MVNSKNSMFAAQHAFRVVAEAGIVAVLSDVKSTVEFTNDTATFAALDIRGSEIDGKAGDMAALFGGLCVAWIYAGISPQVFLSLLKEAIAINRTVRHGSSA